MKKQKTSLLRRILIVAVAAMACLAFSVEDSFARGSGGGGFRSSSSSFRSSSRSSSRSSGWGSRKATTSTNRKASTPKRAAAKPKRSAADTAQQAKAQKAGTKFQSRDKAVSDWKTKNAAKYKQTPTPGAAAPSTRPSHIPQTTSVGGKNVNVTYNVNQGGYGYMNALGTFMLYDAITDAAFMNSRMRSSGYYYPGMYPSVAAHAPPVVVHRSSGFGTFFIICLLVVGFIVVLAIGGAIFR